MRLSLSDGRCEGCSGSGLDGLDGPIGARGPAEVGEDALVDDGEHVDSSSVARSKK
jgi:hypothetical protein